MRRTPDIRILSAGFGLLAWASPCLAGIEWFNETASGKGMQGPIRSVGISVFDQGNTLIGQRNFEPWLWEKCPRGRNHESFFAALADELAISRVEIFNNAQQDSAKVLMLDDVAFNRLQVAPIIIPEPGTAAFLILGAGGLILLKSRRKAAA